jgi:outer membrane protein TolC
VDPVTTRCWLQVLGALTLLLAGAGPAAAQDPLVLTLRDAVYLALEKNLDLVIARYEPPIAREEIRRQRGAFDPHFSLGLFYRSQELPINSALEQQANQATITEDGVTPEGGFSGKLMTGTRYSVLLTAPAIQYDSPNRLFDEYYRPLLIFELVQPLLKEAWPEVNLIRVRQAEGSHQIALYEVEERVLSVIRAVETRYWMVFAADQHVKVVATTLRLAEDLVGRIRRLQQAGLATSLDLRQAEVAVELRRADLERARVDLVGAQAQLRLAVDPRSSSGEIATVGAPAEDGIPVDLAGKLDRAVATRPEVRRQLVVVRNQDLQVKLDRNLTLPNLELVGTLGYTGLAGQGTGPRVTTPPTSSQGTTYFDAFNNFFTPDGNLTWAVGVRLQVPLGNRDALGRYAQSVIRLEQEQNRLHLLRSQIGIEVRTAFQEMSATWSQFQASGEEVRLSLEQLAAQERLLDAGLTTVRRVLEAQDAVAVTSDRRILMLVQYSQARSRLDAAVGSNIETYRLMMAP